MINVTYDYEYKNHHGGIGRDSRNLLSYLNQRGDLNITALNLSRPKNRMFRAINRLKERNLEIDSDLHFSPQIGSRTPHSKYKGIWIVRVHDLFPLTNPEWFPKIAVVLFWLATRKIKQRSPYLLYNSEFTRNEILRVIPEYDPNKLLYFPCGSEIESFDQPCYVCEVCVEGVPDSAFCLTVGTLEPRKNYEFLVQEFLRANMSNYKLVIAGAYGWKQNRLRRKLRTSHNKNIIWISNVCDYGLHQLYAQADFYISNSFAEGFEIPLIEARFHSLPLLLSDIEIHREMHGDVAWFFVNENFEASLKKFMLGRRSPTTRWIVDFQKITLKGFLDELHS